AELFGDTPDTADDFGRARLRVALDVVERVRVTDHVDHNAIERTEPLRLVRREVLCAEVHVPLAGTVILAVHQEYVDTDRWYMAGKDICYLEQDSRATGTIVRARDRVSGART